MALLKTKFLHPVTNDKTVPRPRLYDVLTPKPGKRAAFVVAPAGFGKTTLIAHWAHQWSGTTLWLSLDATDNSLQNFWHYLVGALQQARPGLGEEALHLLSRDSQTDILPAITSLLNELSSDLTDEPRLQEHQPLCLILDDYHLIELAEIHQSLAYFIDYLPPSLSLIISSRSEPELPLARWRVKSYIDELYTTDLAFSAEEIIAFFRNYAGVELPEADVARIKSATSGWIAAVQLMLLSQKRSTAGPESFDIGQLLAGGRRLIDDYVLAEILSRQPRALQQFLEDSASLLRINHELCDYILERQDSRDMLAALEKANLFIVPLDNRQYWYRYHDLFRDALLKRVSAYAPERTTALQRKGVRWFLENRHYHEAVSQLIALKDWEWLAETLEAHGNDLIRAGYHLYLIEWLNLVPSSLMSQSPRLLMLKAWSLFYDNKIEAIGSVLAQLQLVLEEHDKTRKITSAEFNELQGEKSLIQTFVARSTQPSGESSQLSQQVLDQIRDTDIPLKSVSYYGAALDYFAVGELDTAVNALESAIQFGQLEQRYSTVLSSLGLLMWILFSRGDLGRALAVNRETQAWLDNFHKQQPQPELVSCWRNAALCEVYREQDNLIAAQAYLNPLLRYFDSTEPGQRIMIHYVQAGLAFSQQQYSLALEHLDLALTIHEQKGDQIMFEPPALRASKLRCFLAQGDIPQAQIQLRQISQAPSRNPLNVQREQFALARVCMATDAFDEAESILEQALTAARTKGYGKYELQGLILLSLVHLATGRKGSAQKLFNLALEFGEQTESVRLFADEPGQIRELLSRSADAAVSDHFRERLLRSVAAPDEHSTPPSVPQVSPEAGSQSANTALPEPVSNREMEVLELINEGLANKQIASRLNLAPATVKAHIRNLYGKIGASSRTEALARARKLGLLS